MSIYTDELAAERAVNQTLLKELQRNNEMKDDSVLFKLEDGQIMRAYKWENVSVEELNHVRLEMIDSLAVVNGLLGIDANPNNTVNAEAPAAPVVPVEPQVQPVSAEPTPVVAPVEPVAPAAPEQPASPELQVTPIQLQ